MNEINFFPVGLRIPPGYCIF